VRHRDPALGRDIAHHRPRRRRTMLADVGGRPRLNSDRGQRAGGQLVQLPRHHQAVGRLPPGDVRLGQALPRPSVGLRPRPDRDRADDQRHVTNPQVTCIVRPHGMTDRQQCTAPRDRHHGHPRRVRGRHE
jgi:hypothetical protein